MAGQQRSLGRTPPLLRGLFAPDCPSRTLLNPISPRYNKISYAIHLQIFKEQRNYSSYNCCAGFVFNFILVYHQCNFLLGLFLLVKNSPSWTMIRGQKFSFLPNFKYFHFEADAISCSPFSISSPPTRSGRPWGGFCIASTCCPMQVIGSSLFVFCIFIWRRFRIASTCYRDPSQCK